MKQTTLALLALLVFSCSDGSTTSSTTTGTDTDAGTTTIGDAGTTTTAEGCSGTNLEQVVCASNAFLATLSDAEKTSVQYEFTNNAAKTLWSNLPGKERNGLKLSALSTTARAAALALAKNVLTTQGYTHLVGVLAGDDYLNQQGASGYGSGNYSIAFIGTPSTTGDWMLQIGGHHMAYNITYRAGVGYPVPHHLGVEPKASFTVTGDYAGTYQPLQDKGSAMVSLFSGFTSADLTSAYLSGQTFADVLLGPVEYGTGSLAKVVYPTQAGVIVSSLDATQQESVTTAIKTWLFDYDTSISDPLLADYTSADAYAKTYLAYASPTQGTIDPDVNTTYMRIDGPRLWLEMSCQGGVVIRNATHYHTIYRDKTEDYGGSL